METNNNRIKDIVLPDTPVLLRVYRKEVNEQSSSNANNDEHLSLNLVD